MMTLSTPICPLCKTKRAERIHENGGREFWQCSLCSLVFVPAVYHLGRMAERARYEEHQNDSSDSRYRQFLSRLVDPLILRLRSNSQGLDFGCGPGPTVSKMLEEKGHRAENFDPHFFPDYELLSLDYDFITCSETAEHFSRPRREFQLLNRLLRDEGWLGLMTQMLEDERDFGNWYYHRDPTHVCFYSRKTLTWLAHWLGLRVYFPEKTVALFQKCRSENGISPLAK